jgi:serine/threonine-protein kinase PpkA
MLSDTTQRIENDIAIPGYQVEGELGRGGMAAVYLAVQESLHRRVAIKIIRPTLAKDEEFTKRFLREGRLIAHLSDPRIVTVYDIGAHGDLHYLSMEYLPGGSLSDRLREGMDLEQALTVIKTVAGALGCAHQQGIIHRDIKPHNILFRENGSAVLTDFGIAKALGGNTVMTATGMSMGTPKYMSPEQIRGEPVDARSDLYSVGVLFFEMLVGRPPYTAEDTFALAFKHVTEPIPDLPPPLAGYQPIINKLLAKKPAERFATAEEFLEALDKPGIEKPGVVPPSSIPRWRMVVMGLAALLAVAGVVYLALTLPGMPWGGHTIPESGQAPPASEAQQRTDPESGQAPPTSEAQQRTETFEAFLAQARQAQQAGDWEGSLARIAQGLALAPEQAELLALKQEIEARQAESRRQAETETRRQQAAERLTQARQLREAGNLDGSLEQIDQGLRLVPEQDDLLALKREIEARQSEIRLQTEAEAKQRLAAERLTQDRQLREAGDWDGSLEQIDQGLRLVPEQAELLALRTEIQAQRQADSDSRIAALLQECAKHLSANRLTTGQGGNAFDCYTHVLQQDGDNAFARQGLRRIEELYADWAGDALRRGNQDRAEAMMARLTQVNPRSSLVTALQTELLRVKEEARAAAELEAQARAEAARSETEAKARREAETEARAAADDQARREAEAQTERSAKAQASRAPAPEPAPPPPPSSLEQASIGSTPPGVGCVQGDCQNGQGAYHYRNGDRYVGQWRGGVINGQGTYYYNNGEKYVGDFSGSVPDGQGTYYYKSGNEYRGEWRKGEKNGQGSFFDRRKGDKYVGEFHNDTPHGQGTYYHANGDRYVGQFQNGREHGQGTYHSANGERFTAIWENGKKVRVVSQ